MPILRRPLLPWLLILLLTVAFAAALWRPDATARRLGLREMVAERQHEFWLGRMRAHHRRLDATTPAGATIFLGASTVQGLNAARVRACNANFGIGSERAGELVERIGDYRSVQRAGAIVLMTGLNDVLRGEGAGLAPHYRRLIAALPAGTPIIWSSLPRLSPGVADGREHAAAVARANRLARAACATRADCRFVDLHGDMSDAAALTEPDGIHLNPAGYALWSRLVRDALAAAGVGEAPCTGEGGG